MGQAASLRIEQVGDGGVRHAVAVGFIRIACAPGVHAEGGLGLVDLRGGAGQAMESRVGLQVVTHHFGRIACGVHADVEAAHRPAFVGQLAEHAGVAGQRTRADHAAMGEAEQHQRVPVAKHLLGHGTVEVVDERKLTAARHCVDRA